jgi:hypothetical protein
MPWMSSPNKAAKPRAPRWAWITKTATFVVAAAHSQQSLPQSFQLVSSANFTSACRAAVNAC